MRTYVGWYERTRYDDWTQGPWTGPEGTPNVCFGDLLPPGVLAISRSLDFIRYFMHTSYLISPSRICICVYVRYPLAPALSSCAEKFVWSERVRLSCKCSNINVAYSFLLRQFWRPAMLGASGGVAGSRLVQGSMGTRTKSANGKNHPIKPGAGTRLFVDFSCGLAIRNTLSRVEQHACEFSPCQRSSGVN